MSWAETTLSTNLFFYSLENIFNADKSALLYRFLSNKTSHLKEGKCVGVRNKKVRLTGLASGSVYVERILIFVMGK